MKVVDPGHIFDLHVLDQDPDGLPVQVHARFVKRGGEKFPGNVGHYPGTILQEYWRAEIARLKYLNNQVPCPQNDWCIDALRQCIYYLEIRAARRHGTEFIAERIDGIEDIPICPQCGHIFQHTH